MASERNRILDLAEYIKSCGIEVNIGKNKARGNKGLFKAGAGEFRIDIAKTLSDDMVLRTLVHEFSHYIHYKHDKTLQSLEFVLDDLSEEVLEEMLSLTVESIPKDFAKPLFDAKLTLKSEIKIIEANLRAQYSNYNNDKNFKALEKGIKKMSIKYLLSHDRVKILYGISSKIYSIENLSIEYPDLNEEVVLYLNLKSKKRALARINSKINRLNKYYNSITELFARSVESFILDRENFITKAPILNICYENALKQNKVPLFTEMCRICLYNS